MEGGITEYRRMDAIELGGWVFLVTVVTCDGVVVVGCFDGT